jgi:hypothetical protein
MLPRRDTLSLIVAPILVVAFVAVKAIGAPVIDLADVLGNISFEDDLFADQWTATIKSSTYRLDAPTINPVIIPNGAVEPLNAPVGAGDNFVGVLNPADDDINGRLVHDAVSGPFPAGTAFTVTVFGNRGRLTSAPTPLFPSAPSELTLQFFGWKAGTFPFVDPSSDNWSRTPAIVISRRFANWAANGEWASETFTFTITQTLQFISVAVTGKNHKAASYVAFDVLALP